MATLILTLVLLACGDKDPDDSGGLAGDGGADGGGLDGGGDGESDGGTDTESPVISSADAWCYPHTVGEKDFIWQVETRVDDPQGLVSLASSFDGITVTEGGDLVAVYPMVCDDAGRCFGSFTESQDEVRCTMASAYLLQLSVLDEDGNWSEVTELTGRSCPDADPC